MLPVTSLQADDGHDLCPVCLGLDHPREALLDDPCMNCSYMSWCLRVVRLAQISPEGDIPPSGHVPLAPPRRSRRRGEPTDTTALPTKRVKLDRVLFSKVDRLLAEMAEISSLFQVRQTTPRQRRW